MSEMSEFQRRVGKALEGNHGVWFHPFEDKIAVWYGDASVRVFDPNTFEEVNSHTIGVAYRPNVDYEALESAVDVVLSELGYHRNRGETTLFDDDQQEAEAP